MNTATEKYKGFHWGVEPKKVKTARASKAPEVGMQLGKLHAITYEANKAGEVALYEHEFGEEGGKQPDLIADVDNNKLHIIGGDYTITDDGIRD